VVQLVVGPPPICPNQVQVGFGPGGRGAAEKAENKGAAADEKKVARAALRRGVVGTNMGPNLSGESKNRWSVFCGKQNILMSTFLPGKVQ